MQLSKDEEKKLRKDLMFRRWLTMLDRCYNINNKKYKNYGGRGINVYNKWKWDYVDYYFYVISLPNAKGSGLTLDRINNDGNYEPGNLRWADYVVQNNNQRGRIKL